MAADGRMPASEYVVSGTRQIEVPCSDWFMRQPLRVQVLCLLDLALAVLFVLSALSDLREGLAARRRMRQTR
jgi:phosphatidylglycerophosphate synthase